MKYTIPYSDKITLPHIKKIDSIGINADNLNYDRKELIGEVMITGEYLQDNSTDIMEFKHDIPVSFLIDDDKISPHVNISNFKYELIPGRGIEVMFDLDVILSEIKEDEEKIDPRDEDESISDEVTEDEEIKEFQDKIDENLDIILNNHNEKVEKRIDIENDDEIVELEDILEEDYPEEFSFSTNLTPTMVSFDTGFVPRDNDKFTTYKILLVEEDENVDDLLESRNIPKALICNEYKFNKKIVLKIENEQF